MPDEKRKRGIDITPKKIAITEVKHRRGFFYFKSENGQEYELSMQQKLFAEKYLELKGDSIEAIVQAGYNVTKKNGEINRNVAKVIASQNLTKLNIVEYINSLLDASGFTEKNVAKQHAFLIGQFADLNAKGKGIDMFYKRFGLYPKDQAIMDALTKYKNLGDAELQAIIDGEIIDE